MLLLALLLAMAYTHSAIGRSTKIPFGTELWAHIEFVAGLELEQSMSINRYFICACVRRFLCSVIELQVHSHMHTHIFLGLVNWCWMVDVGCWSAHSKHRQLEIPGGLWRVYSPQQLRHNCATCSDIYVTNWEEGRRRQLMSMSYGSSKRQQQLQLQQQLPLHATLTHLAVCVRECICVINEVCQEKPSLVTWRWRLPSDSLNSLGLAAIRRLFRSWINILLSWGLLRKSLN